MRLVLVSQEYPPEIPRGGIGTQTHVKAHGLARLDYNVFVISHPAFGVQRQTLVSTLQGNVWGVPTGIYRPPQG
jgi:hypothetical protein